MDQYDYIIVGAGSAGCVLANRLSADGRHRVLLLEAGGSDRRFWVQVPIGYGKTYYQKAVNWRYLTEPVPGLNGKPSYWPRGRVLGGSSSINAMVFIRGNALDYDGWAAAGNPGWSYADVLPYFKKMETCQAGEHGYRGTNGPLTVSDVSGALHPLCQNYLQAGLQAGLLYNPDFNGARQDGVGLYQLTVRNGFRMSSAKAYLRPASGRRNLTIRTHAHATRVLFEGRRAIGLEYERHGRIHQALAHREVVLSCGAVNTPQLLQLSGIGPRGLLASRGIAVLSDSPAVGENLQDHLGVDYLFGSRLKTLNDDLNPWWGKLRAGLAYLLLRRGPLGLSVNQGGGFFKTDPGLAQPDMQLYFSPVSYTRAPAGTRPLMNPDPFPAFLLGVSNCRPHSRGTVRIRSGDPREAPEIQPNYLADERDLQALLRGVGFIRRLAGTPALRDIITQEIQPGADCASDEDLVRNIRDSAWSVFHACSSCRMGPDPETSVVDHRLRVHGIGHLRIADASVFPSLISGNTNAAAIMVGEKASDLILADAGNPAG
ncbi:MAG: GMC family oxidoreductase N-terminal domain-containing protein [Castellaniella sp.]|jgi:choline dehydrogenase|uniref:GMC family oxidoreductase n=1 Tax=Castellaniella sp. TaxID=1955812 RepID=UPI003C77CDC9